MSSAQSFHIYEYIQHNSLFGKLKVDAKPKLIHRKRQDVSAQNMFFFFSQLGIVFFQTKTILALGVAVKVKKNIFEPIQ